MENKWLDTVLEAQAVDTTGSLHLLNGLIIGSDTNERTGRRIHIHRIEYRISCYSTLTTGQGQCHRFVIVQDYMTRGAALSWTSVFESTDMHALREAHSYPRYKILMDRLIPLGSGLTNASGGQRIKFVKGAKNVDIFVDYMAGDAGTVADILKNSLYFMTAGTSVAGVTAGECDVSVRCWFTDA